MLCCSAPLLILLITTNCGEGGGPLCGYRYHPLQGCLDQACGDLDQLACLPTSYCMLTRVASHRLDCRTPPARAPVARQLTAILPTLYCITYPVCCVLTIVVLLRSKRRCSASAALVAPPTVCLGVWAGRTSRWGGRRVSLTCFAVYRLHTRPRGRGLCGQWPAYRAAASVPRIDELVCPYCLDRPGQHPRPPSLGSRCSTSFFLYLYVF